MASKRAIMVLFPNRISTDNAKKLVTNFIAKPSLSSSFFISSTAVFQSIRLAGLTGYQPFFQRNNRNVDKYSTGFGLSGCKRFAASSCKICDLASSSRTTKPKECFVFLVGFICVCVHVCVCLFVCGLIAFDG